MTEVASLFRTFLPFLATIALVVVFLAFANWFLKRRWKDDPNAQFRFQLIMLALTFAGVLAIVVALPVNDALRGQLLSLIGILLSAAIALSSTTFIGNIMAGIMLKIVKNAKPGDFITVAELTGRITEMDLLHTEIQTEFRDLVTVPNLYMVTQPLKVVRASGTIITAEVSLGYDVAHAEATDVLCRAARAAGLKDPFAQVRELGDFSVVYRVAGLLEEVTSLITARSRLRAAMLDALHGAGIEIVSPNFMNTRALADGERFMPAGGRTRWRPSIEALPEDLAFDKAEQAASAEKLRARITRGEEALQTAEAADPESGEAAELRNKLDALRNELQEVEARIARAEAIDSGRVDPTESD